MPPQPAGLDETAAAVVASAAPGASGVRRFAAGSQRPGPRACARSDASAANPPLAIAPVGAETAWMLATGGLWRTTDGGRTWHGATPPGVVAVRRPQHVVVERTRSDGTIWTLGAVVAVSALERPAGSFVAPNTGYPVGAEGVWRPRRRHVARRWRRTADRRHGRRVRRPERRLGDGRQRSVGDRRWGPLLATDLALCRRTGSGRAPSSPPPRRSTGAGTASWQEPERRPRGSAPPHAEGRRPGQPRTPGGRGPEGRARTRSPDGCLPPRAAQQAVQSCCGLDRCAPTPRERPG